MDFYLDGREIKCQQLKIPEFERRSGLKEMIQQRNERNRQGFELDLRWNGETRVFREREKRNRR